MRPLAKKPHGGRMSPYHALFVDLESDTNPHDNCRQLFRLVENIFSENKLSSQTITFFPPWPVSAIPDLIFMRSSMKISSLDLVHHLRKHWNQAVIYGFFCTKNFDSAEIFQSLASGMDDFFLCTITQKEFLLRLQRLIVWTKQAVNTAPLETVKRIFNHKQLIGKSPSFLNVIEKIPHLALSDAPVLVLGETGTGKELFTRAIHYNSQRHGRPFIPVNCGALPDQLFESEVFGHVKGAFTDASSEKKGLIAEAEGGTIFLDEVDTLSPSAQIKLLRFIQEFEYRPLGSSKSKVADVRLIAATNADLREKVKTKTFREDLYYRLNILKLHIPPLRERMEDIPLLVDFFLEHYALQYRRVKPRISPSAMQKLLAYSWPGNVRELEGVIQQSMVLCLATILQPDNINLSLPLQKDASGDHTFQGAKKQIVVQFERGYLVDLLAKQQGNITKAAKVAGLDRRAFQRLIKKYGIERNTFSVKNVP
jgi:DNA-binding NtrC family response regulator